MLDKKYFLCDGQIIKGEPVSLMLVAQVWSHQKGGSIIEQHPIGMVSSKVEAIAKLAEFAYVEHRGSGPLLHISERIGVTVEGERYQPVLLAGVYKPPS